MSEPQAPAPSDKPPAKRARITAKSPRSARQSGPTDIYDPMVRQESKKALIWLGLAGLGALAVTLSQSLMVVFGGMVFGALLDGGARLLGRILPIGRSWRVMIVLLGALGGGIWFLNFAGTQIADQAAALPATLQTQAIKLLHWAEHRGILTVNARMVQNLVEQGIASVGQLTGVVGGVIGGLTTVFLIVVLGIYFAIDPQPYQRGLAWMLPRESRPFFDDMFSQMGLTMRRLLFGRLLAMVLEGVSIGLALWFYGVPMAALLGLIAGALAFLPNIGAAISGTLIILVGFSGGVNMGLYCMGVYAVVLGIEGNVIVPLVAKKAADLAPALVLAMQLIMGVLFGLIGLMLADPMLAMLKVLLEKLAARKQVGDPCPEDALPDTAQA